jgi:hypothetical protein
MSAIGPYLGSLAAFSNSVLNPVMRINYCCKALRLLGFHNRLSLLNPYFHITYAYPDQKTEINGRWNLLCCSRDTSLPTKVVTDFADALSVLFACGRKPRSVVRLQTDWYKLEWRGRGLFRIVWRSLIISLFSSYTCSYEGPII